MRVYDEDAARACFGDDAVFQAAVQAFLDENDAMMETLRRAVESSDLKVVGEKAHWIKGGLVFLHAGPAAQAAKDLEAASSSGSRQRVENVFEQLNVEVERLKSALQATLHSHQRAV